MEAYKDISRTPEERAQDLLSRLTLEEKMAQLVGIWGMTDMTDEQQKTFDQVLEHGVGQVSTLCLRNVKDVDFDTRWQRELQERIMKNSPHHIPAIFHMEGLCGAFLTGSTSFPAGISRGSSFDTELEEKIGAIVSRQELAAGITQTLAPVLDISRDSRMGRQGETYGEDPTLAASLGSAYVKGLQGQTVDGRHTDGCAKHFLGFHNSLAGIHGANVEMGQRMTEEIYGKPFQAAIAKSGLKGIMPCYCTLNGLPESASKWVLTTLLRDEMGFEGCAISDYGAVGNVYKFQGVGESLGDAGLKCLEAGMDTELPMPEAYGAELMQKMKDDPENIRFVDRAALRVLTAKFRMGLFEHPFALEGKEFHDVFAMPGDRDVSLRSARESMVLLKNDGVLPLAIIGAERKVETSQAGERVLWHEADPSQAGEQTMQHAADRGQAMASGSRRQIEPVRKIAVIGPHAANARSFFGGYTHLSMVEGDRAAANSTAGVGESGELKTKDYKHVPGTDIQSDETDEFNEILTWVKPGCRSLVEELRERFPEAEVTYAHGYEIAGGCTDGFEEALANARDADVILLTLGGKHGSCSVASMGEGVDASDINLPVCQDLFIKEAAKLGKPMVGIHFNGRPISSDVADEYLDAILEAWNPSECGAEAIVDILTGKVNPSGKMPVTTARCAGQIPIFYNHFGGSSWDQGDSIGFKNYVDLTHLPRYYFGQGLSYTTFAYSGLSVRAEKKQSDEPAAVAPDERVLISVNVKNTGAVSGTEIAQLYLRDRHATVARPVMEMQGFARVALKPGEEKRVTFAVSPSQMAFLDEDMKWKIEKGEIEVMVGSSSADIREKGAFTISEDAWIRGRDREFWAETKIQ